jgi:hypothetical protein
MDLLAVKRPPPKRSILLDYTPTATPTPAENHRFISLVNININKQ